VSTALRSARRVSGTITVPGDKSIAHRAALMAILAREPVTARNFPDSEDCRRSLAAAEAFGVEVRSEIKNEVVLYPPAKLTVEPGMVIDCGNSATTARLVAGIAAGTDCIVALSGDRSLSRRPMDRIIDPLTAMGAELVDSHGHLPLTVYGRTLLPFSYRLPLASAQVKSALLLAGLASRCGVTLQENTVTRDHTEIMIKALSGEISVRDVKPVVQEDPVDPRKKRRVRPETFKREIVLSPHAQVVGGEVDIPGDFSTAAYFLAAAALTGGEISVEGVGVNPTRTGFLEHLKAVGATVEIRDRTVRSGEARATVTVKGGSLKARKVASDEAVGMIDELPLVAILAAYSEGTTVVRDARELRVKESDRLNAIAHNLQAMGVSCGMLEDGLVIEGAAEPSGADFVSFGDHRIAMAFSIAALAAAGPSSLDDSTSVKVSCPQFYELLGQIVTK